jgi:hypothetical protein
MPERRGEIVQKVGHIVIIEKIVILVPIFGHVPKRRLTSGILNTEAPRRAALVRKPARNEWAPKPEALRPSRSP